MQREWPGVGEDLRYLLHGYTPDAPTVGLIEIRRELDTRRAFATSTLPNVTSIAPVLSGVNISDELPDVQLLALLKRGSPTNIFGINSPIVDNALEKARQAKTDSDEKAALDDITKYFADEAPAAICHPGWKLIAWTKNVQGIQPHCRPPSCSTGRR